VIIILYSTLLAQHIALVQHESRSVCSSILLTGIRGGSCQVASQLERDVAGWASMNLNVKQTQLNSKHNVPGYKYNLSDYKNQRFVRCQWVSEIDIVPQMHTGSDETATQATRTVSN
jgi:hypothetical protein